MKVGISEVAQSRMAQSTTKVAPVEAKPKVSFESILKGLGQENLHSELVKFSQAIQSGKNLTTKELLYYQVRAGQFGMQVELVSKVGESVTSTVRKLEQGH